MAAVSKSSLSAGSLRRKSKILLLAIWLPALFPTAARAQEASVSMRIDLVAWGDAIPGLSIGTEKSKEGTTALPFRYSEAVAYSGPAVMEIRQSVSANSPPVRQLSEIDKLHELQPLLPVAEEPAPDGAAAEKTGISLELEKRREKDPTLIALAPLPKSGSRRATVLLAPSGDGTFIAYVIDDDPSKLSPGHVRVHNLSSLPIALRCNGTENRELKPRETFSLPIPQQQLIYELAYKIGEDWKIQENNIIPVRATDQTQMIILKSSNPYFQSTDGSTGGFLQSVVLRRAAMP